MCSRTHYSWTHQRQRGGRGCLLWHCKHSVNLRAYWLLSNYARTQRTTWKQASHEIPQPPQTAGNYVQTFTKKPHHPTVLIYCFYYRFGKGEELPFGWGSETRWNHLQRLVFFHQGVSRARLNICSGAVIKQGCGKSQRVAAKKNRLAPNASRHISWAERGPRGYYGLEVSGERRLFDGCVWLIITRRGDETFLRSVHCILPESKPPFYWVI